MAIPDPLVLPSGGRVTFRDSAVYFKRGHHKRLAGIIETADDGTVSFTVRSESGWLMTDVMAEALVESWRGYEPGWYLEDRPIPGDDPSVMADVSASDLAALGKHLVPLAFEVLGLVAESDGDEGKDEALSAALNGSTPISGSAPSMPPTMPAETPVPPLTTLNVDSQIL
jgi:hypothetical protein